MQAQHDFLKGNYPVVRDDAAQMCALQIIVAEGADLKKTDPRFMKAAEKFTTSQVGPYPSASRARVGVGV